jgi:hypothetical protein
MEKQTLETQLLEFQKKISVIKKDSKNPHFKNTYASLTQILSEVKPILNEVGVLITQPIFDNKAGTQLSYNGNKEVSFIDLPSNLTPQQLGSAITYFRRYTLASLLALEIDDDDAQSTNVAPKAQTINEPKPLHVRIEEAKSFLSKSKNDAELKSNFIQLDSELKQHEIIILHSKAIKKGFTND